MTEPVEARSTTEPDEATIEVENIGGIDHCQVSFSPGITILEGQNATNRTSFLSAVAGVLGGSAATLKTDAEVGYVSLEFGEESYTRTYSREGASIQVSGESYSDADDLVDLFACLLEDNPARRVVERGGDLRDKIMEPIDTEEIEQRIRELSSDREAVSKQIESIEEYRDQLPGLEKKKSRLESDLDSVTQDLAETRQIIDEMDQDKSETKEAEEILEKLQLKREQLQELREKIEHQNNKVEELKSEREDTQTELDELHLPNKKLKDIQKKFEKLRSQKRTLENEINDLERIVEFNKKLVTGGSEDLVEINEDDVVAELDPKSKKVECWTCGSHVERQDISDRISGIERIISDKRDEKENLKAKLSKYDQQINDMKQASRQKDRLDNKLEDIERELNHRHDKIEQFEDDADEIIDDINELENEVEETEELRDNELIDAHKELSELEFKRGKLENEISAIEDKISEIKNEVSQKEQLESQYEDLSEEITSLRTRIEKLEQNACKEFNEHMSEVLNILEYENIARVWIERMVNDSSRGMEESKFDLHVVRQTEDNNTYEDSIENLSESEREVIGLVVALAGYLVHEVYDQVPIMILDSLEAIDSNRISDIVEYFSEYAPYLLVALLPEDEQAIPEEHDRIHFGELTT